MHSTGDSVVSGETHPTDIALQPPLPVLPVSQTFATHLLVVIWECVTPPHVHPLSMYTTACDEAFPHAASGMAWVRGIEGAYI